MRKFGLIIVICLITIGMVYWVDCAIASDPVEVRGGDQDIIHMPDLPKPETTRKPDRHREHKNHLPFNSPLPDPIFESPIN